MSKNKRIAQQWWRQGLGALNDEQWEQLCDGCGLCCLHKLEDEDTGEYHYTSLACDLLNTKTCECSDYAHRTERVPSCLKLTKDNYQDVLPWLPNTCAYKLIAQGEALPRWHHLRAGHKKLMHRHNLSVKGKVRHAGNIPEQDYQEYILQWVDE